MWIRRALAPLLLILWAGAAPAQNNSAITETYNSASEGIRAYDEGRFADALEKFSQAYAIMKLPSLAVYMARAHVNLNHYIVAASLYAEAARLEDGAGDHAVQQRARDKALREREALLARMPRLVVQTPGVSIQSVAIQVDGMVVPSATTPEGWQLDPGTHQVAAIFGHQKLEQDTTASDEHTSTVVFRFETATAPSVPQIQPRQADSPTTAPGSRAMSNATWVSFGIGGVALVFSGTTAIWAMVKKHDLDKLGYWDSTRCERAPSQDDCNAYRRLRNWSIVGFYTGLAGAATGTALLLATPSKQTRHPSAASWSPWVGLGSAGVQGQF
jgi:hypothetical protein